jgi:hypothetical protein
MANERVKPLRGTGCVLSLRTSIVVRGGGYGLYAGLTCGAAIGGLFGLVGGLPFLLAGAVCGCVVGSVAGLSTGLLGGAAFAFALPCLVRHPRAVRPAGAAIVPGLLALGWITISLTTGDAVTIGESAVTVLTGYVAVGTTVGAFVGPRVLHGKQVVPPDAGDRCVTGGEEADSPG